MSGKRHAGVGFLVNEITSLSPNREGTHPRVDRTAKLNSAINSLSACLSVYLYVCVCVLQCVSSTNGTSITERRQWHAALALHTSDSTRQQAAQ